ncbi:MAG: sigma 54-interacting transcriptional regulator, partial [Pseudobdellovibrionaceae bacterium]
MSNEVNVPILPTSMSTKQVVWQQPNQKIVETRTIVYKSDAMTQLMKMIDRVAASTANILILGESGTGKELIAHAVHERSNRRNKPFVAI